MRAIVKNRKEKGFDYQEVEIPRVGPKDVLIRVKAAGVCGSDLSFYEWNNPWCETVVKRLPFIPGHECSGEVVEVGSQVKLLRKKDRVSVETHLPCGKCFQCRDGQSNICQNMELFGHTFNGCFAEYCRVPETIVEKIPDGLSWEYAALLEPIGIPLRAVWEGKVGGDSVAVIGCGPIGQFAIAASSAMGASPVFALDVNQKRLTIAKQVGATYLLNPAKDSPGKIIMDLTHQNGVGIIIEASGNSKAFSNSFRYLRKGGKVFMIGNIKEPLVIDGIADIVNKEATIRGLHGRELFSTWRLAESLLLSGKFEIGPVITHKFPLEEFHKGFQLAMDGEACKVLFFPQKEKHN